MTKTRRRIELTIKKYSYKEAEEADDKYWAMASVEERLQELADIRKLVFGDTGFKIAKVVSQRSMYEEEN